MTEPQPAEEHLPSRLDRAAIAVFVIGLVAAIPFLMWRGREQWFFIDEWVFLVDRRLSDIGSLFESHNGHWVTIPTIAFRLTFAMVGIRTYAPYQLLVVGLHVGVVGLMWILMRRLGVRSWIATGTAVPYLVFGAGSQNIFFAFQITWTGGLFFGLAHLLLADHDGAVDWRDALGLGAGFVGLLCSAIAVPLTCAVGVLTFIKRGWRVAALHTLPLGIVFVTWYATIGHDQATVSSSSGVETVEFLADMAWATFSDLGQTSFAALALGLLAIIGLVDRSIAARSEGSWSVLAMPVALVVAFVGFVTLTGIARLGTGVDLVGVSRYVHITAALSLPFVAMGGEALGRHRRSLGIVPIVLLVVGVPANIKALAPDPLTLGQRDMVLALAHSPLLDSARDEYRLAESGAFPNLGPTVAWLRAHAADGRIPTAEGIDEATLAGADGLLALRQLPGQRDDKCKALSTSIHSTFDTREKINFDGVLLVAVLHDGVRSRPIRFDSNAGSTIEIVAGPIELIVSAPQVAPRGSAICDEGPRGG